MSKHTPGPWEVSNKVCRLGDDRYLVVNSSERWVSLLLEGPQSEDDARLIAAAPELLEVMKRALRLSKEHPDFCLWAMEPFAAAIAKAEGRA